MPACASKQDVLELDDTVNNKNKKPFRLEVGIEPSLIV